MSNSQQDTPGWQSAPPAPVAFWQRVPWFFLFPLDRRVLLRIAMLSVLAPIAVAFTHFGIPGLVFFAAATIAVLVVGMRFGLRIVEETSRGFLHPADYPPVVGMGDLPRTFPLLAIGATLVAIIVLAAFLVRGSPTLILLAQLILFGLILPAAVIRLMLTGSSLASLTPGGLLDVGRKIGLPYLALCVLVFVAQIAQQWSIEVLGRSVGLSVAAVGNGFVVGEGLASLPRLAAVSFFMSIVFWYFTCVTCALIGYAMYQYADALEIAVVGPGEQRDGWRLSAGKVDMARRTRDAMMAKMLAAGEISEAIRLINEDLRLRPYDLSLHARLHRLLEADGYAPRIEAHLERYLELLMASDNAREALPLVESVLQRNPNWEPVELGHLVPLARAAVDYGNHKLAAQLIRGFDKRHRKHPDIPYIYLLGAQTLVLGDGDIQQARRLLRYILRKYPDHPASIEARRYLLRLEQMGGATSVMPNTTIGGDR